jgi:hypothetical protein
MKQINKATQPIVYSQNKHLFPQTFITIPNGKFLKYQETEKQKKVFSKLTESSMKELFQKDPNFFDLHGEEFQNFCLKTTKDKSVKEIQKMTFSKNLVDQRISRGRIFGIASREDIDWDGVEITDSKEIQQKKDSIEEYLSSLKLYNHMALDATFELPEDPKRSVQYSVVNGDTQNSVLHLIEKYPDSKIAWVNFANAHRVGGGYNCAMHGSQEEVVGSNGNGIAILGSCGTLHLTGEYAIKGLGNRVTYNEGFHIPCGGNYFCKTKFISGEKQVDCFMIATAFADFRQDSENRKNTEGKYFFDMFGKIKDLDAYNERIYLDIEGVARTAIIEGIDVLVAGASGCGAFRHDPKLEASMWKSVLENYKNYFTHVEFAVLDSSKGSNITAFTKEFE